MTALLTRTSIRPPRRSSAARQRVSAAPGWEYADLGGRHHLGGGSHGSLTAGDSTVPILTVGFDAELGRITEVTPAVLQHFGVGVSSSVV